MVFDRDVVGVFGGLLVLIAVGGIAFAVADRFHGLNVLVVAIVFGAVLGNLIGTPELVENGIKSHKHLLEIAIILMGVRLSFGDVVAVGPLIAALVIGTVLVGIVIVELVARRVFSLDGKTASILASGASICGVSAVVASARAIQADKEAITYAAAAILLFDAVTIVVFPILGKMLSLSNTEFGVWAGLSMFSTGPVVAAGLSYAPEAGKWATITKLTRNALIGVVAVGYSVMYANTGRREGRPDRIGKLQQFWGQFPKFLLGFLFLAFLASIGVVGAAITETLTTGSDWLFILAFAGFGFDIRIAGIRKTGVSPLLTLLLSLVIMSVITLLAVTALF